MVDNAIENGLSPGGGAAKLLKDHRCHASLQGLEVGNHLSGHMPYIWSLVTIFFPSPFGFRLQSGASCSQVSFFAYGCVCELFCLQLEPFTYNLSFLLTNEALLLTMEKVHLISTSTDCKQKASTASKKRFPHILRNCGGRLRHNYVTAKQEIDSPIIIWCIGGG